MGIGKCLEPRGLRTLVLAPDLAIAQEETLFGRVALDLLHCLWFAIDAVKQSHQRNSRAAVVGSVFAEGEFAIQLHIVYRGEVAVLIHDASGTLFKRFRVCGSPPIAQVAFGIKLSAFIL